MKDRWTRRRQPAAVGTLKSEGFHLPVGPAVSSSVRALQLRGWKRGANLDSGWVSLTSIWWRLVRPLLITR